MTGREAGGWPVGRRGAVPQSRRSAACRAHTVESVAACLGVLPQLPHPASFGACSIPECQRAVREFFSRNGLSLKVTQVCGRDSGMQPAWCWHIACVAWLLRSLPPPVSGCRSTTMPAGARGGYTGLALLGGPLLPEHMLPAAEAAPRGVPCWATTPPSLATCRRLQKTEATPVDHGWYERFNSSRSDADAGGRSRRRTA